MADETPQRTFDALPDPVDFRDTLYVPTLVEVPPASKLPDYRARGIPVLDQGVEGACTGYGLATVANYLLARLGADPVANGVSARMLYVMAKRYDEWDGEDYDGSSARGAMKGWHKHGVCAEQIWASTDHKADMDAARAADALKRPLGAYYRVNHKDLVAMHSAITEADVLYATCNVHQGWMDVKPGDSEIVYQAGTVGAHAFAIVGYDGDGFWIQNSWGAAWGSGGLARLSYDDWLVNGTDVWVARLGAPIRLSQSFAAGLMKNSAPRSYEGYVYADLRPHIVTASNDGVLRDKGDYALTPAGLKEIIRQGLKAKVAGWKTKRVMIYAHGGLHAEKDAYAYVGRHLNQAMEAEVYPISIVWRSDGLTTLTNILTEALPGLKSGGLINAAADFLLDRLDDTLEPIARKLGGKALWDEMKENATGCTTSKNGAARLTASHLAAALKAGEIDEVHLVGHSAGAVLHAALAKHLASLGVPIKSVSLWAPACTIGLFNDVYKPLVESKAIEAFDIYTLDDATEKDDTCAHIYNKSLLYLVSAALETHSRLPGRPIGEPLLGLQRDVKRGIPAAFWTGATRRWHLAPASDASDANAHGAFDNDAETLRSTLNRITGQKAGKSLPTAAKLGPNATDMRQVRERLNANLAAPALLR